jgi:hypothetical protein
MKVAIVTTTIHGSPRVLADTLKPFIEHTGNEARIFYRIGALNRLFSSKEYGVNKILWSLHRLRYHIKDSRFFSDLKNYNVIVICGTTPHAFYKNSYNIQGLRKRRPGIPILYYAVQYLENSPTLVEKLNQGGHSGLTLFDWHLSVSSITEIRVPITPPWCSIGLYLKSTGLKPNPKQQFLALVDFKQPGFENYREEQITILEELEVPYIALEKKYTIAEIRTIYNQSSIYFIQSFEAFGIPIAENLACGNYIFTAEASWPMSWRLDKKPELHGSGTLPDCFVVYKNSEGLRYYIERIRSEYDLEETPKQVSNTFIEYYRTLYEGNSEALEAVLRRFQAS